MPTLLITGANRGLGLEFARQYRGAGWRVIATCRDPDRAKELRGLGQEVMIHRLDVTDFAAIAKLGRELASEAVDVFIANAGIMKAADMSAQG
ncbi:MAG TPA: SDR family NAD(P)-dependent oxidoreductase, partial [Stellaceae bacterium]|nr:SDR family NAD(P)-dependent oxidoreductase [Stellaceae bacterium]